MKSVISTYYSDDGKKMAKVSYNSATDRFEVDYIEDNRIVRNDTAADYTLDKCENMAEDYVMGY